MLNRVLQKIVLVRLMNLGTCRRFYDIVLESVPERGLVDDEPGEEEEAEVLDPGLFDRLEDGQFDPDALRGRNAHREGDLSHLFHLRYRCSSVYCLLCCLNVFVFDLIRERNILLIQHIEYAKVVHGGQILREVELLKVDLSLDRTNCEGRFLMEV